MSWSTGSIVEFVFYILLAVVSILANFGVIVYLFRKGKLSTPFTFIVLHLHISIFLEGISTLPYLFAYNDEICYSIEIIHYYCVLMHAIAVFMLAQFYSMSIFNSFPRLKDFIRQYGYYILVIFPLISLFRLTDDRYKRTSYPWCVIHSLVNEQLYFWTFFFWVWLLLVISSVQVIVATTRVYRKSDAVIAWRFFSTIGFYTLIALLNWVPTNVISIMTMSADDDQTTTQRLIEQFPFYFCGILYAIIFFRDRVQLEQCEDYYATGGENNSRDSFQRATTVHFEATDIMQMLDDRESTEVSGINPMVAIELLHNNSFSTSVAPRNTLTITRPSVTKSADTTNLNTSSSTTEK